MNHMPAIISRYLFLLTEGNVALVLFNRLPDFVSLTLLLYSLPGIFVFKCICMCCLMSVCREILHAPLNKLNEWFYMHCRHIVGRSGVWVGSEIKINHIPNMWELYFKCHFLEVVWMLLKILIERMCKKAKSQRNVKKLL